MRTLALIICATLLIVGWSNRARAQYDGAIDFDQSVVRQIRQLEGMVRGDAPAPQQAVVLKWLTELYGMIEQYDQVERCYLRILDLYPSDVGVMNDYAVFLIDTRHDYSRADSLLMMANRWARNIDKRSVFRGRTWELWGRLAYIQRDYAIASRRAELSLELLEGTLRVDPLRLAGRSYRELGQYDLAAESYFELIAILGGSVPEDINELQLFVAKTEKYSDGSLREHISVTIARAKSDRIAKIEAEGGSVIEVRSDDGVKLEATLRRAAGPGAVLFVPDVRAQRSVYAPYAQLLFIDDITTLSVDLRGHGASRADTLPSWDDLSAYHREQLEKDVAAAYRYLRALGFEDEDIAVVSAGLGCALVEKAMRGEKASPSITHLSPAFDPSDRDLMHAVAFHPDRPVLVIFSQEDLGAMRSIQVFRNVKDRSQLQTRALTDAGRGVQTLHRSPEALEAFQQWARRVTATP